MEKQLGIKINFKNIMKFTWPSIFFMMFISFYSMVDSIFIARYVDTDALSAVNIVWPIFNIILGVGLMLGTGSGAICSTNLGRGRKLRAKQDFTFMLIFSFFTSILLSIIGIIFIEPIIYGLGADEKLFGFGYDYIFPVICFIPFFILGYVLQYMLLAAGQPKKSCVLVVIGGLLNIVLDYIFILHFNMGASGAGLATAISNLISCIYGISCFMPSKDILLSFVKPVVRFRFIFKSMVNGSSEMVSCFAGGLTVYLFNKSMISFLGSDGVAAIAIILQIQFLFMSAFFGYSMGVAPLISYNYGRKIHEKLHKIFRISLEFLFIFSFTIFALSYIFSDELISLFTDSKRSNIISIANDGMKIFMIGILFASVNSFSSSFFTAFSNGKISAFISFLRTFGFISSFLIILPKYFGVMGVWLAVPLAEVLTIIVVIYLLKKYKAVYKY